MSSICLVPYCLRIKVKFRKNYEKIDNIRNSGKNLIDIVERAFKSNSKIPKSYSWMKNAIIFDEYQEKSANHVSAISWYGETGFLGKLINTKDGSIIKEITEEDAALKEYYISYRQLPLEKSCAFLLLQKYSLIGCRAIVEQILTDELQNTLNVKDVSIELQPIITNNVMEQLKKMREVYEIELVSKEVDRAAVDQVLNDGVEQNNVRKVSLSFSGAKNLIAGNTYDKIQSLFKHLRNTRTKFYTVGGKGKVEVKLKGLSSRGVPLNLGIDLDERGAVHEKLVLDESKYKNSVRRLDKVYMGSQANEYTAYLKETIEKGITNVSLDNKNI